MKLLVALIFALFAVPAFGAATTAFQAYAVTSGSTTAYTQAFASTPITFSQMFVCDSGAQPFKIAVGAAGSEQDLWSYVPISSTPVCTLFPVNPYIPAGSRISFKQLCVTNSCGSTTGFNAITLLP
jgi:hypothetical protein